MESRKMSSKEFERAVELATGESIESLRKTPIDERRRNIEHNRDRLTHFTSWFPFIGRGNVLRDLAVNHEEADKALEEALRND